MEWGLTQGLAQDLQFDKRIDDIRYNEQLTKRIQAENAAKVALFADDIDYQNAANPYDNNVVKTKMQNKIREIGRYLRDNPDFNTNIQKRMTFNAMRKSLKDDPDLIRGVAVDQQYKEYLKDLSEVANNPESHDAAAYDDIGKQFDNYFKTGNKLGDPTKGVDPPIYAKPRNFVDINERWMDIGNKFGDKKTRSIKGGRNAYEEYANPTTLEQVAKQEYLQNKRQYDIEAGKKGVDPIEYIKTGIDAHVTKKRDFGDYGLSDAFALANYKKKLDGLDREVPPNKSAYQEAFVNAKEGVVSPKFLEQTYDAKPKNKIYSNKGDVEFDNTGNRVYYTGAHKWIDGKNGKQKVVEVYSYLTPEDAKEKGIYDDGAWNPFQGEEISPAWNKQAEIVTAGEGDKAKKMVKVKAFMPVELNESYAGAFDNEVHIAKSKLIGATPNEGGNIPTGTASEFKAAGWNDAQIQQALQQGKIKIN